MKTHKKETKSTSQIQKLPFAIIKTKVRMQRSAATNHSCRLTGGASITCRKLAFEEMPHVTFKSPPEVLYIFLLSRREPPSAVKWCHHFGDVSVWTSAWTHDTSKKRPFGQKV